MDVDAASTSFPNSSQTFLDSDDEALPSILGTQASVSAPVEQFRLLDLLHYIARYCPSVQYFSALPSRVEISQNLRGSGYSMEVYEWEIDGNPVALKFLKNDRIPIRNQELKIEDDDEYLIRRLSYEGMIKDVLFELQIMSRVRKYSPLYKHISVRVLTEYRLRHFQKPLCDHTNILPLLGLSFEKHQETDGEETLRPVLVVELAHHQYPTLVQYVKYLRQEIDDEKARIDACCRVVAGIADGLSILHRYGVTHADLKPENILMFPSKDDTGKNNTMDLVPKISDFGFSGIINAEEQVRGRGTHSWRAPEVSFPTIGEASKPTQDVYAFGLVALYVFLLGDRSPAAVDGFSSIVSSSQNVSQIDVSQLQWNMNLLRKEFIERIHRRYNDRPETMEALVKILEGTLCLQPAERWETLECVRPLLFKQWVAESPIQISNLSYTRSQYSSITNFK